MKNTIVVGANIGDVLMKQLVAAAFTANTENIAAPFSGITSFFTNLGSLGGPKIVKLATHFDKKTLDSCKQWPLQK